MLKIKRFIGRILRKFKKYFSTNILFFTYVVTSTFIAFLLRINTLGTVNEVKAFICDVTIVVLLGSFGYLIKPNKQFVYFLGLSIFYSILCIINDIYFTFYSNFVSVSMLSTLSMFKEVSDSVTSRLELAYFVYLLAPVILTLVNVFLCKKGYYFKVGKYERGKKMFTRTIGASVAVVLIIIVTLVPGEASKLVKQWNRDYNVNRFGLYLYTFNDLIQSLEPAISPMFGYDKAAKTFNDFYNNRSNTKEKNQYTNIFSGKNVIFIHAESLQNFLIDLEINGIEITPNFNKLAKEGMYFSSFYPQISVGTSSDTEFTLSTGLLPSSSGTVFMNFYDRKYETIQNAFNKKGYYTFSMHANAAPYWNRKTMYKTLGYQDFYAKDRYIVPKDKNDPNYVGLGLSDKSFFEQIIPILTEIKNTKEPFMGTIITLSNHSPFNDLTKYGDLDFSITYMKDTGEVDENGNVIKEEVTVPYLEGTEMGNYLKSVHYADEAIGLLFTMLEESDILDNTVVIIYGDHESKLGKKNLNLLYNYDIETESIKNENDPTYIPLDNYRYDLLKNTPLIIWTKDKTLQGEVKDVMGMWDVFPTVANMFNLDYTYPLGNDIFSNNEKIVVFPNGNVLTNKVYYSNLNDEYILLGSEPIDSGYIERIKNYALERLEVSQSIIIHDMIKKQEELNERVNKNEKNN